MIAGHFIPAGTDVRVDIMGMHYDPDLFPDPKVRLPWALFTSLPSFLHRTGRLFGPAGPFQAHNPLLNGALHNVYPQCFRPSRFLKDSPEAKARHQYAYLPFGAGPRMCIGYKFALQEIMLTLVTVLRSYSFALDTTRDQTELKTTGLVTMGPAEGVWLKVARRELQG